MILWPLAAYSNPLSRGGEIFLRVSHQERIEEAPALGRGFKEGELLLF
jgi:hypothetical protein